MNNSNFDIYEKITFKLVDALRLENISWLKCEVTQLLLVEPKLIPLLQSVSLASAASAVDNYFDKERDWSSHRVCAIADNIISADESEYRSYSLLTFITAGLTIELAIQALAETKYDSNTLAKAQISYLESIFCLNAESRKQSLEQGESSSAVTETTISKSPSPSSNSRKRKLK